MTPSDATAGHLRQLAWGYLDAQHRGDIARLREIFHPRAVLMGTDEGRFIRVERDQWLDFLASRPPPLDKGEPFDPTIGAPSVHGLAAVIVVTARFGDFVYDDVLSLVRTGDEWTVVTKVFNQRPLKTVPDGS